MLRTAEKMTKNHARKKWIIFWALLTVSYSLKTTSRRSPLTGETFTVRLSLLWLFAASITYSSVHHGELGLQLRLGPFGTYQAIEVHDKVVVR